MPDTDNFSAGDFLLFQLESGYGLLRLLAVEQIDGEAVWHISAYRDFFLDVDSAETATQEPEQLLTEIPHAALTDRAFESTQLTSLSHVPLTVEELAPFEKWKGDPDREISDRSVRLLLGIR